jgi:hypothetical protein
MDEKTTTRQLARRLPPNMPNALGYDVLAEDVEFEGPPVVGTAEARPESEKGWLKRK